MPGWRAASWRWRTEVTTTRIHDLAAEFGISSEQLMGMLKELDIFVRSHLSPLKPEQVALMRARWEREKRKLKEAPAAPKRRRTVKAAEPVAGAPQAGRERHARQSRASPLPPAARRLRRPGGHSARGAPPRKGEEAQEREEVARGSGGRRAEHLPHPRVHQKPGRPQGRASAGGRPELPRPGGAEAAR